MINSLKNLKLSQAEVHCKWSGAVNFLFVEDHLILIKRSESMPSHAGQLGFLGGHKNESENHPFETAKREFEEEAGISSAYLNMLSVLDSVKTSKGKIINPVLTYCNLSLSDFLERVESNGEWVELIAVPFSYLTQLNNWTIATARNEYEIYFCPILSNVYQSKLGSSETQLLWGATAKMIWNFFKYHQLFDK